MLRLTVGTFIICLELSAVRAPARSDLILEVRLSAETVTASSESDSSVRVTSITALSDKASF